jgi:ubiquinone/menaquinone biosynthesis C-methylase UbiE
MCRKWSSRLKNTNAAVVESFGQEWGKFNQSEVSLAELQAIFDAYFAIFPWGQLPPAATGFDLGCGSGRWARFVAPRVGRLHCMDASSAALEVARQNLATYDNCDFHCASVDLIPLPESSADFGYSLGVLHHVPDTQQGIAECVRKLKPGAPFLVYLYYAFDNRPWWFRVLWRTSDLFRRLISRLPFALKSPLCDLLALVVYWPLARTSKILQELGMDISHLPLAAYRDRAFYSMRTDALDRFGTRLEKRFTRNQIQAMMEAAGLDGITFGDGPYWCAVGYRSRSDI